MILAECRQPVLGNLTADTSFLSFGLISMARLIIIIDYEKKNLSNFEFYNLHILSLSEICLYRFVRLPYFGFLKYFLRNLHAY